MIVGSAIFWFIVLCLKYNPFVSWLRDLRNESKNKVVVILSLFYKSPYFWLWLAGTVYKVMTKMETLQHAVFYMPLWYICPTGLCLIVWHYQLKHTWPGKKPDQIKEHSPGINRCGRKGLGEGIIKMHGRQVPANSREYQDSSSLRDDAFLHHRPSGMRKIATVLQDNSKGHGARGQGRDL